MKFYYGIAVVFSLLKMAMRKILVVNNDYDTMTLLKEWLERKCYQVAYTGNADGVPELIDEFNPDLLLIDILQKEVIGKVKNDKKYNNLPVILLTGATLETRLETGADDVIDKPFNLQLLEKKIRNFIPAGCP